MRDVLAEGDQTGKRCDQGARAADVDAEQQLTVIIGELGEQNGTGNVADALAGQGTEQKNTLVQKNREHRTYALHASHVACKNEKADEGQEQGIVNLAQRFTIGKQEDDGNEDQTDPVRDGTEDDGDGENEQSKVERRF